MAAVDVEFRAQDGGVTPEYFVLRVTPGVPLMFGPDDSYDTHGVGAGLDGNSTADITRIRALNTSGSVIATVRLFLV